MAVNGHRLQAGIDGFKSCVHNCRDACCGVNMKELVPAKAQRRKGNPKWKLATEIRE
jgi:hypothetical protein